MNRVLGKSEKISFIHLFIIILAFLLIPVAFFFNGMAAGLLGLLLVVLSSVKWPVHGWIISTLWSSLILVISLLLSPIEGEAVHIAGGMVIYFILGIGLGRYGKTIRKKQLEINSKNEALIREKKQLEALFKSSLNALVFFDRNHLILDVNQQFTQLFGYKLEEVKGMNIDDVMDIGKQGTASRELTEQVLTRREPVVKESTRYSKDGRPIEVVIKGVPIFVDNELIGGYTIYDDITYRKYYEKHLEYLSFHDQLTDLYNRSFFEESLERFSKGDKYPVSIVTVDLNGLKLINDTMGHCKGDELLRKSADILKESARETDIVCRIGGDEFSIILPLTGEENLGNIVNKIRSFVKQHNCCAETPVSISIGAATAENKDTPLREAFRRADDLMYSEKLYESTSVRAQLINALMAALAERDDITEGHAQRLTELSLKIGEKAGLPPQRFGNLALLAQVHDLGKVGIPDNILFKKGPLTEKEWEVMRLHPEKGYRIALSSPDLSVVADLILKHHEKWDGTGYPLGLKGEEIPIECRIIAIVDAFDAMTSNRPYSNARSAEEAVKEIKRCAGTQFDPDLVDIFLTVLEA